MRRLLLQAAAPAGILFGGRERPGRQVRAPIRRPAVHRDARHRPPLKTPVVRPTASVSSGDFLFFSSSSCGSREETSCYTRFGDWWPRRCQNFARIWLRLLIFFFSPFLFSWMMDGRLIVD